MVPSFSGRLYPGPQGKRQMNAHSCCQSGLKGFADFDVSTADIVHEKPENPDTEVNIPVSPTSISNGDDGDIGLNLSYTINLVLPKTDDVAVFNAIFKSLRENLLKK